MDKKRIVFIIGLILVIALGIIALSISKNKKETTKDDNPENNVLKNTTIENITITNQSIVTKDGLSTYTANVANNLSSSYHIDKLSIIFTINDEELNISAATNINLEAKESFPLIINFDQDISKLSKIDYKVEK